MFLFLCFSQLITIFGSELTRFAIPIWLYNQTGSASTLTVAYSISFIPRLILGPFVGVWLDHASKKKLLIISETGQALTIFGLLYVVTGDFKGTELNVLICTAMFLQSLFALFQHPGIAALTPTLLSDANLQRGNSLLSTIDSASLVLGPVAAGFLLSVSNLETILYFDALSFVLSIGLLFFLPAEEASWLAPLGKIMSGTKAAFFELINKTQLLKFILLGAALNFSFSLSFGLLNPYLQLLFKDRLDYVGLTNGIAGAFEVLGAIAVMMLPNIQRRVRFQLHSMLAIALLGAGVLALANGVLTAVAGLSAAYFTIALVNSVNRTAWQLAVPREEVGRFFAIKRMVSHGLAPLGFLLSGAVFDGLLRGLLQLNELASFRVMFALSAAVLVTVVGLNYKKQWVEEWDEKFKN